MQAKPQHHKRQPKYHKTRCTLLLSNQPITTPFPIILSVHNLYHAVRQIYQTKSCNVYTLIIHDRTIIALPSLPVVTAISCIIYSRGILDFPDRMGEGEGKGWEEGETWRFTRFQINRGRPGGWKGEEEDGRVEERIPHVISSTGRNPSNVIYL